MELAVYKKGDKITLSVVVRAPAGLDMVEATAFRKEEPSDSDEVQLAEGRILLVKHAEGQTDDTRLVLEGEVRSETPGVYSCGMVLAYDVHMEETRYPLEPPRLFRVVPNPDIPGSPEVKDVGQFE